MSLVTLLGSVFGSPMTGVTQYSVRVVRCMTLFWPAGGAGKAAAAGKSHIRGLRQRQNYQERQLLTICKSVSTHKKMLCRPFFNTFVTAVMCHIAVVIVSVLRASSSNLTSMSLAILWEQILTPVSIFWDKLSEFFVKLWIWKNELNSWLYA